MDPNDPEKRHPWVAHHQGPVVVYGHTPVLEPAWRNQSIDIDTGCVFGWRLTALRWPERTLVSVPARRVYARRHRPFLPSDIDAATQTR
jgi:protein phosphatase